jgi:hypothetical protein
VSERGIALTFASGALGESIAGCEECLKTPSRWVPLPIRMVAFALARG